MKIINLRQHAACTSQTELRAVQHFARSETALNRDTMRRAETAMVRVMRGNEFCGLRECGEYWGYFT